MALLARGVLQRFRKTLLARPALLPASVLSWSSLLVQTCSPVSYRPYRFADPAAPFALASALRFSDTCLASQHFNRPTTAVRRVPCSYRVLPNCLLAERLADTSPGRNRAAADKSAQRLSWTFLPYSTSRNRRSTFRTGVPSRTVFRLQGLVTLLTGSSLRVPVGFVSRRRRSWAWPLRSVPLSKGIEPVSEPMNPPTVSSRRYSRRNAEPDRRAAVPGL